MQMPAGSVSIGVDCGPAGGVSSRKSERSVGTVDEGAFDEGLRRADAVVGRFIQGVNR